MAEADVPKLVEEVTTVRYIIKGLRTHPTCVPVLSRANIDKIHSHLDKTPRRPPPHAANYGNPTHACSRDESPNENTQGLIQVAEANTDDHTPRAKKYAAPLHGRYAEGITAIHVSSSKPQDRQGHTKLPSLTPRER